MTRKNVLFILYLIEDYLHSLSILLGMIILSSPFIYLFYMKFQILSKLTPSDYALWISMGLALQISTYFVNQLEDGIQYAKEKAKL